ncbi:TPA: type II toxin-antitoxin system prevent-host-death family antitoxin [Aeromonas salmonicida subsp. smithia]|uniref:type II toxin-antitoxin system prevent-host-death family antitoxin n=1 Tax=Aeromonas salmonicida TaxID=645 RepID=UPI002796BC9C|nr:type II toxin-antitoxin system prevent-host-death family antitoxin [Aeromonas salmonicida]MDQ1884344.1 type II toxin-antitoxin system prevent-host-death family antitoxin [Aeromonas salmonicida]
MKTHTSVQIINQAGKPAFVVIPYEHYLELMAQHEKGDDNTPDEVLGLHVEQGLSLLAAWRIHKKLSQQELAARIGISQSAVAQMEKPSSKPRTATLHKVANALGIPISHLIN